MQPKTPTGMSALQTWRSAPRRPCIDILHALTGDGLRRDNRLMRSAILLGPLVLVYACSERVGPPYSPAEALATFELDSDFEVELFVAEPNIADPVAMAFGPDGRIWVAESSGYPLDVSGGRGRIKLLEDTDSDGRPDKTTLFADKLTLPTGVMPWKDGVLVTDAPDVLYLADEDGDGKADIREPLLTGFAFTNPQHTVSSPVYGLDNWIYLSHEGYTRASVFAEKFGDTGSQIHFPNKPEGPRVPVERRSVRFRPDTFDLELLAGPSQFGLAFSEWGDTFSHNNTYHVRHDVIAARYFERNPKLLTDRTSQNAYFDPAPATVYPIALNPRFEMLSNIGQMTSASGLTRYLGGAFPGYEDLAVVAEPTHNLVHADRWEPSGSTFLARPLHKEKEFLASRDAWFRPVNFTVGPDGALYVIDYYRDVIEHPEWTSAETYEDPELLYSGDDRGRIWRITPKGGLAFPAPRLNEESSEQLAERLQSSNIWDRRTAQCLIVERGGEEAVPALREIALDQDNPVGRVHALWTLEGLGALEESTIVEALGSGVAGVRRNAILLAEPRYRLAPAPWRRRLMALGEDEDPQVRLQLLLTLGEQPSDDARRTRDELLFDSLDDEWVQIAALTWRDSNPAALLNRVSGRVREDVSGTRLLESIASLAGDDSASFSSLLASASRLAPGLQAAVLQGLTAGLRRPEIVTDSDRERIIELFSSGDSRPRAAALALLEKTGLSPDARAALDGARELAGNKSADPGRRADALRLLGLGELSANAELFVELIDPSQPEEVQASAIAGFAAGRPPGVVEFLLERWRELPAKARFEAGEALTQDKPGQQALVEAIEAEAIQPWMLSFRQRRRLVMHPDPDFRERARAALDKSVGEREEILEIYRQALAESPGDSSKGRVVFERVCKECHQLSGRGSEVGPDLSTVRTRPAFSLLNDILLPNETIAQTYEAYVVETTDGRILDGVIGEQGPTTLTLRREGGETDVIDRSEIRSMRAAQLSAMPSDLEEQVDPTAMADVIRYIQTSR